MRLNAIRKFNRIRNMKVDHQQRFGIIDRRRPLASAGCPQQLTVYAVLLVSFGLMGCDRAEQVIPERRPRPVIVTELKQQPPPHASMVSASVGSWKTEEIGFEVGGRIEYVVEPNTEIEGRILDKDGNLITEGIPIGQLESERYSLQVAKAKADVVRADQNLQVALTEFHENIPAQIAAANRHSRLSQDGVRAKQAPAR